MFIENMVINIYNHDLLNYHFSSQNQTCSTQTSCETDGTNIIPTLWHGPVQFSMFCNLKMVEICLQHTPFDLKSIAHERQEQLFEKNLVEVGKKVLSLQQANSVPKDHLGPEADLRFILGGNEKNNRKPVKLRWAHLLFSDKAEITLF